MSITPPDPNATQPKTTTDEIALKTEGQRAINRLWENSQARIAWMTVSSYLVCCVAVLMVIVWRVGAGQPIDERMMALGATAFVSLASTVSGVIGFYFGRTNHQREGGVGPHIVGR